MTIRAARPDGPTRAESSLRGSEDSPAYTHYVLALLFGVAVLNMLDRQILGMLIEPIKAEFGVSDTAMGLLSGPTFALFYALAGIPIARWADRGVRRSIIALGLLLWSGLTLASGLAQGFGQLVLARLGVGIGEAAGTPPSHALITDYFPPDRRAAALAIFTIGASTGVALAHLVGGWVSELWGWRMVFIVAGVPGLVLALLLRTTVREPPRGRFEGGAHAPTKEGWLAAVRVLAALPSYRHLVASASLHSFAFSGSMIWYPPFLTRVHDLSPGEIGTTLALYSSLPAGLGIFFGGIATDRLARRDIRWLQGYAGVTILLFVPFALGFLFLPSRGAAFACLLFSAFLMGTSTPGIHVTTQTLAPPRMRALASAINLLMLSLVGAGLGPFAVGWMNDWLTPSLGDEAVRYTLSIVAITAIWSGLHNLLSARHLATDLAKQRVTDPPGIQP
jgi:predicted MFS family arabinose efflux permease